MRRMCSLTGRPRTYQATRSNGNKIAKSAVAVKAFEVQPPHLRYQPKTKTMLTIQTVKIVTPIQSMRSGSGFGGRSGLMKLRTSGNARAVSGTLIQKIQRHERASLTRAVSSGVVGRVA